MKPLIQVLCAVLLGVTTFTAGCGDRRSDEQRLADALTSIEDGKYRAAIVDLKNLVRIDSNNVQYRLVLGEASLLMGDAAAAEKELLRAQALGADPESYMVLLARSYMQRKAYADLIAELDPSALDDAAQRGVIDAYIGRAMVGMGSLVPGREKLDAVLNANPPPEAERVALLGKADLSRERGDLAGAEALIRRAIDSAPESVECVFELGTVLLRKQEFAEAEKVFDYGLTELKPSAVEEFMMGAGRVEALLGQNRVEEGVAAADELAAGGGNHPMIGYLRGRAAFQSGDMESAITLLQEVLSKYPEYPPAQSLLGAANLNAGNLDEAEMILSSTLARNPKNTMARQLLAETRLRMQRPDDAADTLRDGLSDAEGNPGLLAMLGRSMINLGDQEEGLGYLEASHKADPNNTQILLTLAAAYVSAGRSAEATEAINKLPEGAVDGQRREVLLMLAGFDPANPNESADDVGALAEKFSDDAAILSIAGSFYQSTGDTDKALASFKRVLEIEPENRTAMFSIGRIDDATGDFSNSKAIFERYLEAYPNDLLTLLALSRIVETQGDSEKSVEYIMRANKAHPDALLPNLILAGRAIMASDLKAAESYSRAAVKFHSSVAQAHTTLAMVLYRSQRVQEALDSMSRAVTIAPDNAQYHHYRGQLQLRLSMLAQARESFANALRLDSTYVAAARELALLEVRARNAGRAETIVAQLKREMPNRADILELEGDINALQEKTSQALVAYTEARSIRPSAVLAAKIYRINSASGSGDPFAPLESWLASNPTDVATRLLLAQEYQGRTRDTDAIEQYEMILDTAPQNALALNNLAWLYLARGGADDRLRALDLGQKAYEIAPGNADVADTYGWILVRSGQLDAGARILREALGSTTPVDNPDLAYHLAAAFHEMGRNDEAKRLLTEALGGGNNFYSRKDARELLDTL